MCVVERQRLQFEAALLQEGNFGTAQFVSWIRQRASRNDLLKRFCDKPIKLAWIDVSANPL